MLRSMRIIVPDLAGGGIGFDWINLFGMMIVILLLIPNVIYLKKFPAQENIFYWVTWMLYFCKQEFWKKPYLRYLPEYEGREEA